MSMTYGEALDYIHAVGFFGSRPGLDRISELCARLDNPQKNLAFIHVAGTNGKGSVCAMLAQMLTAAGLKTGLYTSPYVSFFEERIRLCGEPIPKARLTEVIEKVKNAADGMSDSPTEFEVITAAAFLYYFEEKCDAVVLETGLGGRLDATNIIENPALTVITGISLDHKDVLGDTEEKIAAEKGGIIKQGVPLVLAKCSPAATEVITKIASEKSAPIITADYKRITNKTFSLDGARFNMRPYGEINIKLAGVYQINNAAVAITAAEALKSAGFNITDRDILSGLSSAVWNARFEVINREPTVVYEGAHNGEGAQALAENIRVLLGGKAILLAGVMADKDFRGMAKTLSPYMKRAFTVKPDNPRALGAEELSEVFVSNGVKATPVDTVDAGVKAALDAARSDNLPLIISGTLYMYKQAKDAVLKYL